MSLFIRLRWLTFVTLLLAPLFMFSPWTTVQAASGGISVVPGLTFGYLPLNVFGGNTTLTLGDNGFENISVPGYLYAGQTYTTLGITANGFLVVGGATAADLASVNQNLPDTAVPNNVLAPFWTDLNPGNGGRILINVLTDGVSSWIVVEWERVPDATDSSQVNTFQIWIGVNGTQDVSFTYGVVGSGADGLLTVGAENADGSSGQAVFYNGAGTLPAVGTDLRVMYTPDTATPTATNTPINTPTNTPVPPTNTPTSTPTNTPVPPTNTPTSTPTNTATPTNTPTITPVPIPSCNGRTATISVKNGKIVGGPDAGKIYTGTLNGTIGNDVIVGTEGTDTVDAKAGNDTICGLAGDDKLTADAGDDYVDGGRGNDTLKGSSGTDLLLGGDNDDALDGDDGNDTLIGGAGNDFLDGDKHNDTLTGGSGKDTFKGGDGTDTATDVNASEDDTTSSIP